MELTVADVLNQAADLIEADGFYQGGHRDDTRPATATCAQNAISRLTRREDLLWRASLVLVEHLNLDPDGNMNPVSAIIMWNDSAANMQTVLTGLRSAATAQ